MITLILRSVIIYIIVLFAVRIMGKRQIGDMQPFELVITLIIADLACIPMSDSTIPIVFGIVPLFTLVIVHFLFSFFNTKSIFFRKLINGKPVIVIDNNGINYPALKKLNMTLNDLTEGLRIAQCFNINDVAYAIVETNGNISVLLKASAQPPTIEDFGIDKSKSSLNIILINDGKIIKENLSFLNLDESFINKVLEKENINNIKKILIMTLNDSGEIYLQQKNQPCKTLQKSEVG